MPPNNDYKGSDIRLKEGLVAFLALLQILGAWLRTSFLAGVSRLRSSKSARQVRANIGAGLQRLRSTEAPNKLAAGLKSDLEGLRSSQAPQRAVAELKTDLATTGALLPHLVRWRLDSLKKVRPRFPRVAWPQLLGGAVVVALVGIAALF